MIELALISCLLVPSLTLRERMVIYEKTAFGQSGLCVAPPRSEAITFSDTVRDSAKSAVPAPDPRQSLPEKTVSIK